HACGNYCDRRQQVLLQELPPAVTVEPGHGCLPAFLHPVSKSSKLGWGMAEKLKLHWPSRRSGSTRLKDAPSRKPINGVDWPRTMLTGVPRDDTRLSR